MDATVPRALLAIAAGWMNRHQARMIAYLQEENRVLLEQLGNRRPRLTDVQRRRLAVRGKALGRRALTAVAGIVTPDTILRWHRTLIARKYDGSTRRGGGRPRTSTTIAALVVRMARENPGWGYTRIRGALHNLGHTVGRSTIARVLAEHGIDPAPHRPQRWSTFLKAHWGGICGGDFFTVEVMTLAGLIRYHVFFVIDLKTRLVEVGGIVHAPGAATMKNIVRGLVDEADGFLARKTHLILDRDPVFTAEVRALLRERGVTVVRLPARSPNLNAHAERFVGSIRRECLSRVVPLGRRHLRTIVTEYVRHYNAERNHQGVDNRLLAPEVAANGCGAIENRSRLWGLLGYYCRETG